MAIYHLDALSPGNLSEWVGLEPLGIFLVSGPGHVGGEHSFRSHGKVPGPLLVDLDGCFRDPCPLGQPLVLSLRH